MAGRATAAVSLRGNAAAAERALVVSFLKPGVSLRALDWDRVATDVLFGEKADAAALHRRAGQLKRV